MPAALEATTTQSIRILRLSDQADVLNPDPDPAKDEGPRKINAELIEHVRGQARAAEDLDRPRQPRRRHWKRRKVELDKTGRLDRHREGRSRRHRPPRDRTGRKTARR